jgi:hypothetical protein
MKKTALLFMFSLAFFCVFAQKSKTVGFATNDLIASGAIAFSVIDNAPSSTTDFKVAPSVAYFLTDNFALGFNLGYGSSRTKTSNVISDDNDLLEFGLHARYFFTPTNAFSLFSQTSFNYVSANDQLAKVKNNGFEFALAPGINYFLSENVALQATLGRIFYNTSKSDVQGAKSNNTFGLNLDLSSISFGLNYKF